MRPRTTSQPPHGWSVAELGLSPGLQPHLPVAHPAPPSNCKVNSSLGEMEMRHIPHSLPRSRPLSRFFSPLGFSEGLRGWPELVGEEVFHRTGSMLCVWAARADRADLYRVHSGFPFPVGSLGRSCSREREVEKPWPSGGWAGAGCRENRTRENLSAESPLRSVF